MTCPVDRIHKDADCTHKDTDCIHKEKLTNNEWDKLYKIAEHARQNKRLPPSTLELIITQLCQKHWLTRRQLSKLLKRNDIGLRSRFLTPMTEHGILQLRYPDKTNRIEQIVNFLFFENEVNKLV